MCGWKDRCRDGNLRTYCHVSPILFGWFFVEASPTCFCIFVKCFFCNLYNRTGLQFQTESKQLSEVMQVYIATITGMLDVQLHYNPFIAGAIEMKNTAALQTFL